MVRLERLRVLSLCDAVVLHTFREEHDLAQLRLLELKAVTDNAKVRRKIRG